jgi:hypothetical protein
MYDEAVQPVCTTKDLGVDSAMFESNSPEPYSLVPSLCLTQCNFGLPLLY